jgi:tetratricopeptide (TPR) repeat protein
MSLLRVYLLLGGVMKTDGWRLLADMQFLDLGAWFELARAWIVERWAELTLKVEAVRKVLDPVIWIVGSVLALVPGSYAIYKWWYYRESRLPDRLADFLKDDEKRLHTARNVLFRNFERPTHSKSAAAPIFLEPSMKAAMRRLNWSSWWSWRALPSADHNLGVALKEIESQMELWEKQHAHYKRQEAAAYLLRGAIAAGAGSAEDHKRALDYFLKALAIDGNDIEALEYAAHQCRVLGEIDEALANYDRLAELTDKPGTDFASVRAKALHYAGEMCEKKYDKDGVYNNLNRARNRLRQALEILPVQARGELDHAATHEVLGRVEDKRGTTNLPVGNLQAAQAMYRDLIRQERDAAEADAGLVRVSDLLRQIDARNREDDDRPVP